ncbi:MAG: FHA domain-containing protein [Massilia sp.]
MNKCSNPAHPHCTMWVAPGASSCASGHPQGASVAAAPSSFDLISARRRERSADGALASIAAPLLAPTVAPDTSWRPHLHVSGFDPRAAGGRQALKLELRGMPAGVAPQVSMLLQSALIGPAGGRHVFSRTLRGDWRPVFIEFSSRGKEHGQYQIDIELLSEQAGGQTQRWACTMLILVPRADASLTEIHQIFLSTHKNVRVVADDASIAKVYAQTGGGRLDIDLTASNASIAHLNLDNKPGKVDLGFSTIAWDEDLIEIDVPALAEAHPHPSAAACLVNAAPEVGAQRQTRLFALEQCVLGRFEQYDPEADVLLTHFGDDGQDREGLTRRLSGRHAVLRRGTGGFEIEDISRYGILLDGVWPGKHKPVPLRLGMRIEFTASIKGVVVLGVSALLPHGVIMHRLDQGEHAECFYFLEPERQPGFPLAAYPVEPRAAAMPMLFHRGGGFWHLDPVTGKQTALTPDSALDKLCQFPRHVRFASDPYPECWIIRSNANQLRRAPVHDLFTA